MAGKLCVSVIEARNLQADDFAEKNFYVKLRVGSNEVGPRGDLVVGSDDLRILTITARGTIVHWFQLRTAGRSVSAELCLVLRYLSAGSHRPMSPTYAIAARQAKERALEAPAPPMTPSTSAFRDLNTPTATATPSAMAPATTSGRYATSAAIEQQGSSFTAVATANGSGSGHFYGNGAAVMGSPGTAASVSGQLGGARMAVGPAGSGAAAVASTAASRQVAPAGPRRSGRPASGGPGHVPLPLAVLGGMVVGALVYLWKKRPVYYEVQEDDTLCHIASCFKKRVEDVYQKNRALLKNPSRLYPGDRLRIR
ncbi:hypothetical protein PLESTF_000502100 [Pleodorina starrii]|nr:hypothetical protein PLESTF_000502100 [Pleodorina starrii]